MRNLTTNELKKCKSNLVEEEEMGWKTALSGYFLILFSNILCDPYESQNCYDALKGDTQSVHDFTVEGLTANEKYDFSSYKNKVMLIVNVASF